MRLAQNHTSFQGPDGYPRRINQYDVHGLLEEGEEWISLHATDSRNWREVIITLADVDRLRSLGGMRHPNLLPIIEAGICDGSSFIVLRADVPATLRMQLRQTGQLSVEQLLPILAEVAAAVDTLHAHGKVHGGIRPDTIGLREQGEIVLAPVGASSLALVREEETHAIQYLAPEQLLGEGDLPSSDIYSIAVTAFECLSSVRPYLGVTARALAQAIQAKRRPALTFLVRGLPAEIEAVFVKALAGRPEERYATASDFITALRKAFQPSASASASTETQSSADFGASAYESAAQSGSQAARNEFSVRPEERDTPLQDSISHSPWEPFEMHGESFTVFGPTNSRGRHGGIFSNSNWSFEDLVSRRRRIIGNTAFRAVLFATALAAAVLVGRAIWIGSGGGLPQQSTVEEFDPLAFEPPPASSPVIEMTDRQLLGAMLTRGASANQIISALHEAEERRLGQLADVCGQLLQKHNDPAVRREAALISSRLGERRLAVFLLPLLDDPSSELRLIAARGLETIGDRHSAAFLTHHYRSESDPHVRAAIKKAVVTITALPFNEAP